MEIIAGDAPFICRCLWSVEIKNNPWNATFKETHGTRHSLLQSKALLSLHPETAVCRIECFVEAAYIVIFLCSKLLGIKNVMLGSKHSNAGKS
jgi:hypothetical protein